MCLLRQCFEFVKLKWQICPKHFKSLLYLRTLFGAACTKLGHILYALNICRLRWNLCQTKIPAMLNYFKETFYSNANIDSEKRNKTFKIFSHTEYFILEAMLSLTLLANLLFIDYSATMASSLFKWDNGCISFWASSKPSYFRRHNEKREMTSFGQIDWLPLYQHRLKKGWRDRDTILLKNLTWNFLIKFLFHRVKVRRH